MAKSSFYQLYTPWPVCHGHVTTDKVPEISINAPLTSIISVQKYLPVLLFSMDHIKISSNSKCQKYSIGTTEFLYMTFLIANA